MNTPERERFKAMDKYQETAECSVAMRQLHPHKIFLAGYDAAIATRNEEHQAHLQRLEAEIEHHKQLFIELEAIHTKSLDEHQDYVDEKLLEIEQLQARLIETENRCVDWATSKGTILRMYEELQSQVAMKDEALRTCIVYPSGCEFNIEKVKQALTASPSNYIEKINLEARIDGIEWSYGVSHGSKTQHVEELRAQLAALEGEKNGTR